MNKSKRRGPRKLARSRKARSRRYGGMDPPAQAAEGEPAAQAEGAAAFGAALAAGSANQALSNRRNGTNVVSQDPILVNMNGTANLSEIYGYIEPKTYPTFSELATKIQNIAPSEDKSIKIVALLSLIKYHILKTRGNAEPVDVQTDFIAIVARMGQMKKTESDTITDQLDTIVNGKSFKNRVINSDVEPELLEYVNSILTKLRNPTVASTNGANQGGLA